MGKGSRMVTTAAVSAPTNMAPVVSMVTDTITGNRRPTAAMASSRPWRPALICNTSWQVSSSSRSTPPSINPLACRAKSARSWSKSTWAKLGSLVVGPMDPATKRGFPSPLNSLAVSAANSAPRLLMA